MLDRTLNRMLTGIVTSSALTLLFSTATLAQEVSVSSDFKATKLANNIAGGVSYLPDGDILAFTNDYVNGPSLLRYDANGDGLPAGGQEIFAQFDSSTFPDFVEVSPSGKFALAGVSGSSSTVFKVDLGSKTVSPYFTAPGNFDLVFIDETKAYLSANPGGFNSAIPNEISLVELSATPTMRTVISVGNTPSGPIALNNQGDLYYVAGTFTFPAPANSSRLLRFAAADLALAASNSSVLAESNAASSMIVPGGYDMVFHKLDSSSGELFISTIGSDIYRVDEKSSTLSTFLSVTDPTFPALTAMSFFKPTGVFSATEATRAELALSLTTEFFTKYSMIQVRTTSFDTDSDGTADSNDSCPKDGAKITAGVCGCGNQELDSNGDKIVDCGAPRGFARDLTPRFASIVGAAGSVTVNVERLMDTDKVKVTLKGISPKRRAKTKSFSGTSYTFTKLKPGQYQVKFQIRKKVGRRTRNTLYSVTQNVTVF